jgi:hypothetical protein
MAEVQVATVRAQVVLSLYADFENFTTFKPGPRQQQSVESMLDQLVRWASALSNVREMALSS